MQTKNIILDIKKELKQLDMLLDGMSEYPSVPAPLVTLTETKLIEVMERLAALKSLDSEADTIETVIQKEPELSEKVKSEEELKNTVLETPKEEKEEVLNTIEKPVATEVTPTQTPVVDECVFKDKEKATLTEEAPIEEVTQSIEQEEEYIEEKASIITEETIEEAIEEETIVAMNEEVIKSPITQAEEPVNTTDLDTEPFEQITEPVIEETQNNQDSMVISSPNKTTNATANGKTLVESLQGGQSRNDALTAQGFPSLSSQMAQSPIGDIKRAINLNDRFRFQKELFDNDGSLYNKTVDTINALNNIEEAQTYITTRFAWDFDEDIAQEFIQLVQRRFI